MARGGRSSGGGRSGGSRSSGSRSSGSRSSSSRSGRSSSSRSSFSSSRSSSRSRSSFGSSSSFNRTINSYGYTDSGVSVRQVSAQEGRVFIATVLTIMMIITLVCVLLIGAAFQTTITTSTIDREPLAKGAVIETEYYTDEIGWIDSVSKLESGMKEFYNETGVQPYVYITDTVPAGVDLESYTNSLYDELFKDEAHFLLLFYEPGNEYYIQWVCGAQAKTVIDQEAADIILDYIEKYYYSDLTESEFFSKAFSASADRIMTKTTDPMLPFAKFFAVLAVIGIAFIWWTKAKIQKNKEAEHAEKILNTPLDTYNSLEDKYKQ